MMCFFELFASAVVMQVFITIFFELGEGEVTDNLYITSAFIFQALTFLLTMGMIMGIYHRKAKQLLNLVEADSKIMNPVIASSRDMKASDLARERLESFNGGEEEEDAESILQSQSQTPSSSGPFQHRLSMASDGKLLPLISPSQMSS